MNCTNQSNQAASATDTAIPTTLPYRATLHPTLRALWNIPHVIEELHRTFPDLVKDTSREDTSGEGRAPCPSLHGECRAASAQELPDNPPASSVRIAPTPQNSSSSLENTGQNPQPSPTTPDPEWPKTGQHRPTPVRNWPANQPDSIYRLQ
jgi:hypothetical protein